MKYVFKTLLLQALIQVYLMHFLAWSNGFFPFTSPTTGMLYLTIYMQLSLSIYILKKSYTKFQKGYMKQDMTFQLLAHEEMEW